MNWAPFFGRLWALFASRHRLEYETLIAMAEEISETDEEVKSVASSESCRMRAFTFNAWSVVSMVLLVILVGQWKSGSLCSNEESSLIWDLPQSGESVLALSPHIPVEMVQNWNPWLISNKMPRGHRQPSRLDGLRLRLGMIFMASFICHPIQARHDILDLPAPKSMRTGTV